VGTERISRVVGLMPFVLKNEGSQLQRFLSALVHVPPFVRVVWAYTRPLLSSF
jgi:hypothetical protein